MQLARNLAYALDPVLLARAAGMEPDGWQKGVLRTRAPQAALLCARQTGKSSVTAVSAVHEALFFAPALVLIVAPALRQAEELFRKIRAVLARLGAEVAEYERDTVRSLEMGNGSRIICLPDKEATIRSYSAVDLLLIDEAAWVRDSTYEAVLPMLAVSRGRVLLLSTPFGRRGFFFREWSEGGPRWARVTVTAYECPRIDRAWLEEQKRHYPPLRFRSEFLCEFVETEDSVFTFEQIQAAISDDVKPLWSEVAA